MIEHVPTPLGRRHHDTTKAHECSCEMSEGLKGVRGGKSDERCSGTSVGRREDHRDGVLERKVGPCVSVFDDVHNVGCEIGCAHPCEREDDERVSITEFGGARMLRWT